MKRLIAVSIGENRRVFLPQIRYIAQDKNYTLYLMPLVTKMA